MDPRAFTGYQGIGVETATFYADDFGLQTATIEYDETADGGSPQVGLAVSIVSVASGKVEIDLVPDNGAVLGKLLRVEGDGACTVQIAGAMTLPGGSGATLTLMSGIVGDEGPNSAPGYVKAGSGRGVILDNSVTTAVQVWL